MIATIRNANHLRRVGRKLSKIRGWVIEVPELDIDAFWVYEKCTKKEAMQKFMDEYPHFTFKGQ